MKKRTHRPAFFAAVAALAAAGIAATVYLALAAEQPPARWYSAAQVRTGEQVFEKNCLSCHGVRGQATANWRQRNSDGAYPPPPLNGTAHTWHHPLAALKQTIKNGGKPLGGSMPAFRDVLSDAEIDSVLAYIQSLWPDEIYQVWEEKVNRGR